MTLDVSLEVICGSCLFMGGQLVTLASVVRSNRDQGRRIGALERWKEATIAIQKDRRTRIRTAGSGVPLPPDDDQ